MNPAMYTKWQYDHKGEQSKITVVGIWGKGSKDNYQVTDYDLKQANKIEVDTVSAERMKELIDEGIIRPI
jgi:hypothetical protein